MFLSTGQIFGEESIILNSPALYSVKCRSATADVFIISEAEFNRRIKRDELTMKVIEQNCD